MSTVRDKELSKQRQKFEGWRKATNQQKSKFSTSLEFSVICYIPLSGQQDFPTFFPILTHSCEELWQGDRDTKLLVKMLH